MSISLAMMQWSSAEAVAFDQLEVASALLRLATAHS